MKNLIIFFATTSALVGCGDNKGPGDARQGESGVAVCTDCPPAPALLMQIDRMGRPAINTVLNRGFTVPSATVTMAKDMYNQDANSAMWQMKNTAAFARSLAIVDSLDTGVCGNGICELGEQNAAGAGQCTADCPTNLQVGVGNGCGNQALYNGKALGDPGKPMTTSYQTLAGLMANDELYLDTSKVSCTLYLAVEFGVATTSPNTTCGGRAPTYDVIDSTLSVAAMGIAGFDLQNNFAPRVKDNAPAHADYTATFPFFGPPHP